MQLAVMPYCGSPPVPAEAIVRWNFDPWLMAVLAAAYIACSRLGARSAPLMASIAVLLVLFASPLCALGSALFSVRVSHHLILTALAAPLIAVALPLARGSVTGWTAGHAVIWWVWHTPTAYAFALASDAGYWLMQGTLLLSAVGFWRAARAAPPPVAVAGLLATMVQMGLLAALLTFSGVPVYGWHLITTEAWGLTPLEDQQLAGLIMWVPGAGAYLGAALWFAGGWFGEQKRLVRT